MGQYSFDPAASNYELQNLFRILNAFHPEIPADYYRQGNSSQADPRKIRELTDNVEKYKSKCQEYESENLKLKQELAEAQRKCEIAKVEKEKFSKSISDLKSEKDALDKKLDEKERELKELERKLARYEPSLNGETKEIYFNIDGDDLNLSETYDDKAPFIGKVSAGGDAIFSFNDKGMHQHYSQNPTELEKFCEILDSVDSANHISPGEWGKGKFSGGKLQVRTKAKIKLTRE